MSEKIIGKFIHPQSKRANELKKEAARPEEINEVVEELFNQELAVMTGRIPKWNKRGNYVVYLSITLGHEEELDDSQSAYDLQGEQIYQAFVDRFGDAVLGYRMYSGYRDTPEKEHIAIEIARTPIEEAGV